MQSPAEMRLECADSNCARAAFAAAEFPVTIKVASPAIRESVKRFERKRLHVADTTKIEDKLERKKLKRAARKKAAPKAKRTGAARRRRRRR